MDFLEDKKEADKLPYPENVRYWNEKIITAQKKLSGFSTPLGKARARVRRSEAFQTIHNITLPTPEQKKSDLKAYIEAAEREINILESYKKDTQSPDTENTPEDIGQVIHEVASEISRKPNSHGYETIADALKLYYSSTDLTGKEVADKAGVSPSVFSTWKTKVEKEL